MKPIVVDQDKGVIMYTREEMESDDCVVREQFKENVYDFQNHKVKSNIVVDIGANIGAFSVYASMVAPDAKVYAYEPELENYSVMVTNIEANKMSGRIFPVQKAVTALDGKGFIEQGKGGGARMADKGQEVERVSLTSILKKFTDVDFLKIDTEGSEYDMIVNTSPEILKVANYIAIEFHVTDRETFGSMIAQLTNYHKVIIIGTYARGGQIYAQRY